MSVAFVSEPVLGNSGEYRNGRGKKHEKSVVAPNHYLNNLQERHQNDGRSAPRLPNLGKCGSCDQLS